ncbi:hypothetical protein B0H17DRAFT_1131119 [Mycena rosella]|uniref:Uncharacterized protein n=1 Tax=Mycena rosella TaxID=1033263 RepID=A0AAD7GL13_MYCRO|nr:hypothetical protein B0H17DRAFT_1131119 [Mycena rosella]
MSKQDSTILRIPLNSSLIKEHLPALQIMVTYGKSKDERGNIELIRPIASQEAASEAQERIHSLLEECGVSTPAVFHAIRATRSLISGSFNVAVLAPTAFKPNDLDMYMPGNQERQILAFVGAWGYTETSASDVQYPGRLGIKKIYWFTKNASKINIMIVRGSNTAIAVFLFHSSIVMNFLCDKGLYCSYLELTTHGLNIINTSVLVDTSSMECTIRCLNKYASRGITTKTELSKFESFEGHICQIDGNCPSTIQFVHNEHGLFYHMPQYSEDAEDTELLPFDEIDTVAWRLGGDMCGQSTEWKEAYVVSTNLHELRQSQQEDERTT